MIDQQIAASTRPTRSTVTKTPWPAVVCLSLMTFSLVSSEFLPVSLLTPIATDLGITEGQAGQGVSVSALFAIVTSLFANRLIYSLDRRTVVLANTAILVVASLATAFAFDYPTYIVGRALVGIAVGGFWSLSTAIIARIAAPTDVPKALALLQVGTALAAVLAQPIGALLGGALGWRGAFAALVPILIAGFIWQLCVLPRLPSAGVASLGRMFGLLRSPVFLIGMGATGLAFMGQFSLSTYLRPFLEVVTGFDLNQISLALFGIGAAGLIGTSLISLVLRRHLNTALVTLPAVLSGVAVLLIILGTNPLVTVALLSLWGLCTTPIPVAWGTWMTRLIPHELEAGGGVQVALIQFAIGFGAATGGFLFDGVAWWAPFVLSALLLALAAGLALAAAQKGTS